MPERTGETDETLVADSSAAAAPAGALSSAPTGPVPEDEPAAGTLLAGRFELRGLLGVGGMGSVFRALDRELDELVAVKVLRRELATTPAMLERFRREVKLARRVTHPHVARTFDIGEDGPIRFLTMELIDGRPLSGLLARPEGLPLERTLAVAEAIAEGLAAAHAAGVVHRDLKPDNVLVERTGRVVLTDFGIARPLSMEGEPHHTHGVVVGTPLYMAPEQVTQEAPIGPATDLFALGCMLFEMLAGRPPFSGPSPLAVAAARLTSPAPHLATVAPRVPSALADLVARLLQREIAARPASAAEVQSALASLRERAATSTAPVPISAFPAPPAASTPPGPSATPSPSGLGPSLMGASGVWSAPKTVAVLPIADRIGADDAYLAAGLTDDLVDLLSASPGLRVRPRGVVEQAARELGPGSDPAAVGRRLGAQVVVSGELRRHGAELLASVRVVTVEDGFQLWAGRFRKSPAELLEIGDAAAAEIARVLATSAQPPRDAPTDPRALELYLRGRYLLQRSWGATPVATPLLREAVERAPHDLPIRLTYARALVRGVAIGELPAESASTAWGIIEDALRADPNHADARLARASLLLSRGEVFDGVADLRAALAAAPDMPETLTSLGDILADAGVESRAVELLERAVALEPGPLTARVALARLAALRGEMARCQDLLGPPSADPIEASVHAVVRARLALWSGDEALARGARDDARTAPPGFLRDLTNVVTGVVLGDLRLEDLERLRGGLAPRAGPRVAAFHLQFRAELFSVLGRTAEALDALRAAAELGTFDQPWVERCPPIQRLRGQPGFADAENAIRLRAERVRLALGDLALESAPRAS